MKPGLRQPEEPNCLFPLALPSPSRPQPLPLGLPAGCRRAKDQVVTQQSLMQEQCLFLVYLYLYQRKTNSGCHLVDFLWGLGLNWGTFLPLQQSLFGQIMIYAYRLGTVPAE